MKMRSLLGLMVSLSVLGASFCHAVLAEDDSFFRNLSKETLSQGKRISNAIDKRV